MDRQYKKYTFLNKKIDKNIQTRYESLKEKYAEVVPLLQRAGRVLTGEDKKTSLGYGKNTSCSIIPHGGFGLLDSTQFFSHATILDSELIPFLTPFDLDIMLFCNKCLETHEEDKETLLCEDISSILITVLNSFTGDPDFSRKPDSDYSHVYIPSKNPGDPPVDIAIVNALEGGLKGEISNKYQQLNIEKAILAYSHFPEDLIEESPRFMRVKIRAALANEILRYKQEADSVKKAIENMNENKKELLKIEKNLTLVEMAMSEFTSSIERLETNDKEKDRNLFLAKNAISHGDKENLKKALSNSYDYIMRSFQEDEGFISNNFEIIYTCLFETDLVKVSLEYLDDVGYIVQLFQSENQPIPGYDELNLIIGHIRNTSPKTINDKAKTIEEIYSSRHGFISEYYDTPLNTTHNIFIYGEPGFTCFSTQKGEENVSLKDSFLTLNDHKKIYDKHLSIHYSLSPTDKGKIIEFHTENGIVENIADIYLLSTLLFYGKHNEIESNHYSGSDISNVIKSLTKHFRQNTEFHSHSCLTFTKKAEIDYLEKTGKMVTLQVGGSSIASPHSHWASIILGVFAVALASVVGPVTR